MVLITLAVTAERAQAAASNKIVFTSDRIAGFDDCEGDYEVYSINALYGAGKINLTDNKVAYDGFYVPGQQ